MALLDILEDEEKIKTSHRALTDRRISVLSDRERASCGFHLLEANPDLKLRGLDGEIQAIEKRRLGHLRRSGIRPALADIISGNAILFAGAGFSMTWRSNSRGTGLTGDRVRKTLVAELREDDHFKNEIEYIDSSLSLAQTALLYQRAYTQHTLHSALLDICCREFPKHPLPQHQLLARLNCFRYIITTNWDRLIEYAYSSNAGDRRTPLRVVREGKDLSQPQNESTTLIKLHGDLDQEIRHWRTSPLITQEDLLLLEFKDPALYSFLRTLFLSHRIIVVGLYPQDYNLVRLLHFAATSIENRRPLTIVDPQEHVTSAVPVEKPVHIQMPAMDFLETVKSFIDTVGGQTGQAFSNMNRHPGFSSEWAAPYRELAVKLQEHFPHLDRVEVVGSSSLRYGHERSLDVARRAAVVMEEMLSPGKSVAVSCGTTLHQIVNSLNVDSPRFQDVRVFATSIPLFDSCDSTSPFGLVSLFASRLNHRNVTGRACQLPAGFAKLAASEGFRSSLLSTEDGGIGDAPLSPDTGNSIRAIIQDYLREAAGSNMFFLGVGAVDERGTALGSYALSCLKQCDNLKGKPEMISLVSRVERYFREISEERAFAGDLMYQLFRDLDNVDGTMEELFEKCFVGAKEAVECLKATGLEDKALFREWYSRLFCHVYSIAPSRPLKK